MTSTNNEPSGPVYGLLTRADLAHFLAEHDFNSETLDDLSFADLCAIARRICTAYGVVTQLPSGAAYPGFPNESALFCSYGLNWPNQDLTRYTRPIEIRPVKTGEPVMKYVHIYVRPDGTLFSRTSDSGGTSCEGSRAVAIFPVAEDFNTSVIRYSPLCDYAGAEALEAHTRESGRRWEEINSLRIEVARLTKAGQEMETQYKSREDEILKLQGQIQLKKNYWSTGEKCFDLCVDPQGFLFTVPPGVEIRASEVRLAKDMRVNEFGIVKGHLEDAPHNAIQGLAAIVKRQMGDKVQQRENITVTLKRVLDPVLLGRAADALARDCNGSPWDEELSGAISALECVQRSVLIELENEEKARRESPRLGDATVRNIAKKAAEKLFPPATRLITYNELPNTLWINSIPSDSVADEGTTHAIVEKPQFAGEPTLLRTSRGVSYAVADLARAGWGWAISKDATVWRKFEVDSYGNFIPWEKK